MEKKKVKKTNGGFWTVFWAAIGICICLAITSFIFSGIIAKMIMIIAIVLVILFCGNAMKRSKENEHGVQTKNGVFTEKYYGPGDNLLPLEGLLTNSISYHTGNFTIEVPFEEITMPNADNAAGIAKLTFVIKPEDCSELFKLTDGAMDKEKVQAEILKRLGTTIEQGLGSTYKILDFKEGWEFEDRTYSGEISKVLGKHLTGVEAEYGKLLKNPIFVPSVDLHLLQVEIGDVVITGEAYKARQQTKQQDELTKLEASKQETFKKIQSQFDNMVDTALDAALERKRKYGGQQATLTEEEMNNIYDTVSKNFRQKNGAEMVILEGNSGINQSEFLARRMGNKPKKST